MEQYLTTEGIILRTTPYRERDHILVAFTREFGVVSFFISRAPAFCAPLYRVEFVYSEGKGSLCRCREVSLLESYLNLRSQYNYLEAACDLLKVIQLSQLEGKPASLLYDLLQCYLERIPFHDNFSALAVSFRLKVLHYEGVLSFPLPNLHSLFSPSENQLLHEIMLCRRLSILSSFHVSDDLRNKLERFFHLSLEKEVAF